jgi:hypothetical protein
MKNYILYIINISIIIIILIVKLIYILFISRHVQNYGYNGTLKTRALQCN